MGTLSFKGRAKALYIAAMIAAIASPSVAGEEVLIRNMMSFYDCPGAISTMLDHLGANPNHIQTISDTGAHYYVALASYDADLEFRCNAVTEQLEVLRITPGTLNQMAEK